MSQPIATGPKAYTLAVKQLDSIVPADSFEKVAAKAALAQALATLALTAATVEAAGLDAWCDDETGASGQTAWGKAVSR